MATHVGVIGFTVAIDVGFDVSGYDTYEIHYKKPDGTVGTWTATLTGQTILAYTTQASSDLDVVGIWELHAYVAKTNDSKYVASMGLEVLASPITTDPNAVQIPQEVKERILAPIGYPVLSLEEDFEVSYDFLVRTAIHPAMKEYFRYFPIQKQEFYAISSTFEIAFPDPMVYGIADARIHPGTQMQGLIVRDPNTNMIINNDPFASSVGMYGTRNDYGMSQVIPLVHSLTQARRTMRKKFAIRTDEQNRVIKGYTNSSGQLEVSWAYHSKNWSDIKFVYEDDVINLASANVLDYFAKLRGQESSDQPVQFDATEFADTARVIRDDVLERWRAATKVALIRK